RDAVPGRLRGALPVQDEDAPVVGGGAGDDAGDEVAVVGDDGAGEAPFAPGQQVDRVVGVAVGHQGAHRAEGLDGVRLAAVGVVDPHEVGRHEGALVRVGA